MQSAIVGILFFVSLFSGSAREALAADLTQAAVVSVDVTPPVGVPLGGYGAGNRRLKFPWNLFHHYKYSTIFTPSTGVHDPIRAKAFLLKTGDKKIVFISLDVVGISEEVYKDTISRLKPLGYEPDDIFFSATHTHSGPGTLSNTLLWEIAIMDFFQKDVYEQVIGGVVSAVLKAETELEPADLFSLTFKAADLQMNRRKHEGHFDPQANLLLVKSKLGAWIGGVVNFAIHGTAFSKKNLDFSADVPGGIEHGLEGKFGELNQAQGQDRPATFMFINGAEGDVAPKYGEAEGITLIGDSFANQTLSALPSATAVVPEWRVFSREIDLGHPGMNLEACGVKTPIIKAMTLGLGSMIPGIPRFSIIRLGGLVMVTWPGEPTTSLGTALKEGLGTSVGTDNVWLLSLTNGYVAYFTTAAEYFEGGYEACSSLYGPDAGEKTVHEILTGSYSSFK